MIGVTLLAVPLGYVGWQALGEARIADERQALLKRIVESGGDYQPFVHDGPSLPFVRRWRHDRPITTIWLPKPDGGPTEETVRTAFPEAQLLH